MWGFFGGGGVCSGLWFFVCLFLFFLIEEKKVDTCSVCTNTQRILTRVRAKWEDVR